MVLICEGMEKVWVSIMDLDVENILSWFCSCKALIQDKYCQMAMSPLQEGYSSDDSRSSINSVQVSKVEMLIEVC